MKVLMISHTCQSRTEGQPKAMALARLGGIDLKVVVPDRWRHYGKWRRPEIAGDSDCRIISERVCFPWLPGAQNYMHFYPGLGNILREWQPDVVDLWEEPWSLVSAHTCWLRNRLCPRARIVAETEQNILKTLPPPFERFRSYVHQQADFLVGRSREAVAMSRSKGFSGPTMVVPNGVDTELFQPLDRAICRREIFGASPAKLIAGYVGRLVPEKGIDDLLEALRLSDPSIHAAIIGGGPMSESLASQAREGDLAGRLHILPPQPLAALPRVMNALDALVLPSRTTPRWKEQFGRVIIEAQACGTAVIGSDSGAIPDVVGEGGLIVPERNPRALAGALKRLTEDPGQRAAMGFAGRENAVRQCSWQSVAAQMADIYSRVLSKRMPSRTGETNPALEILSA